MNRATQRLSLLMVLLVASQAAAQLGAGGAGGGLLGGLTQSGQLTSTAAIQRDPVNFLSGTSASVALNPNGSAGGFAGGGGNTGFGGLGGLTGAGGFGGGFGGAFGAGFGAGLGGAGRGGVGGFANQGFQNQGQTGATPLRIPMRIGFSMSGTLRPASAEIETRLGRLPALKSAAANVSVRVDGQTAVLSGVVGEQREKDLIARLIMLEPGIAAVRNDLRVEPASALPAPRP